MRTRGAKRGAWANRRGGAWAPALAASAGLAIAAAGWQDAPPPAPTPASEPEAPEAPKKADEPIKPVSVLEGPPTILAFKKVTVEQVIPFIVEATGKVVVPQNDVLSRTITILNDRPIPREQALDLVFVALQQNQIAVVVHPDRITLRDIGEITRQDVPVIGPEENISERNDLGTIIEKVYALKYVTAKKFGDAIKGGMPDYAKMTLNEESNRIAVLGSVALNQRVERLVKALDQPPAGAVVTETFKLKYAEASAIVTNINDLYGPSTRQNRNDQDQFRGFRRGGEQGGSATTEEVRVSANTQQNSVTVVADPIVIEQIRSQIANHWDKPLPDDSVNIKTYQLVNSDPVKVKDLLEGMFGKASTSGTGARPGGQQGQQGQPGQQGAAQPAAGQGVGRLANQFSFQAMPDSGRLVVVARSPDNMAIIDKLIEDIDKPQSVGLPEVVELKHANAEDLAEQLNTLLALDGTFAQLPRSEKGLSASTARTSPFATSATTTNDQTDQVSNTSNQNIQFWWQRASRSQTEQRLASNLVGKIRIVPVWRQNALMIVSPPEYRASIAELISRLDRPGRQVLLSAIVADLSLDDATALGLRWSSQTLTPSKPDTAVSIGTTTQATNNNFANSLFDTSVLNANMNINLLLQALNERQTVTILSEPRLFTGDNQEAEFFDGQDIPFVTNTQTNSQGNLVQSFDYRAVGINLRIRPRITPKREVDLKINLELSSIVPGQTLFGGFIVDRRETTTQVIVADQQTIVISGIMRSEDSTIIRKIPGLGDIPLLGELFKSREKSKKTTELLVFITPVVVNNPEESTQTNKPFLDELEKRRGSLDEDQRRVRPAPVTPSESGGESGADPKPPPRVEPDGRAASASGNPAR